MRLTENPAVMGSIPIDTKKVKFRLAVIIFTFGGKSNPKPEDRLDPDNQVFIKALKTLPRQLFSFRGIDATFPPKWNLQKLVSDWNLSKRSKAPIQATDQAASKNLSVPSFENQCGKVKAFSNLRQWPICDQLSLSFRKAWV